MNVIAVNGSPRPDGNTARLLRTVCDVLEAEGITTETFQLGGQVVRGCNACYQCVERKDGLCVLPDDAVTACLEKMKAADGMLLGSPTYFSDVTAEMKALIDRAGLVARVNGDLFRRKVGAAVVAVRRGGAVHAFDTLNHFFLIGGMIVPGSIYWNFGIGRDKGEVEADEEGIRTMTALGENMAWVMKRTRC
ncbi:MAG: flavodoxin family protein [Planctomycetota bacterium]|nr:flavodoxin family protein [Planctomycetota bacterium]